MRSSIRSHDSRSFAELSGVSRSSPSAGRFHAGPIAYCPGRTTSRTSTSSKHSSSRTLATGDPRFDGHLSIPGTIRYPMLCCASFRGSTSHPWSRRSPTCPCERGRTSSSALLAYAEALQPAVQEVWRRCMREMEIELPLLILDEAHHLKNRETRFASLFASPEAKEDADLLRGPFASVFDRMLFLTATPFQLGHHELVEVLRRFTAIRWGDGLERQAYINGARTPREVTVRCADGCSSTRSGMGMAHGRGCRCPRRRRLVA